MSRNKRSYPDSFLGEDKLEDDENIIAKYFIDYFSTVRHIIQNDITPSSTDFMINIEYYPHSFFMSPSNANEMEDIIKKLKPSF